MRNIVFAAAFALAASTAIAAPVAHSGADWVMLTDQPCPEVVASKILPQYVDLLREAKTVIGGKPFVACWLLDKGKQAVTLLFEDGDEGYVSLLSFHDEAAL
jgi:hypothetical protein